MTNEHPCKHDVDKTEVPGTSANLPATGEVRIQPGPLQVQRGKDGNMEFIQPQSGSLADALAASTGTRDATLGAMLLAQVRAVGSSGLDDEVLLTNSVSAAMLGVRPEDEVEGMLAAQMVAVHNQAMEFLRLATLNRSKINFCESLANTANKLLRTYAMQVEALTRYRKKGTQTVTVEHVHVHQGGQAIVGNVGGGGSRR